MKDEIKDTRIVEKTSYTSKKGKTFEFIGQEPSAWKPAEIKGFLPDGRGRDIPVYHIGSIKKTEDSGITFIDDYDDYEQIKTPYSIGSEPYKKLVKIQIAYSNSNTMVASSLCELCGHGINEFHILINYTTKQYMQVGSSCIHNHYGRVIREKIKIFKDNKLRQEFVKLRDLILPILGEQLDLKENDSAEHRAYVIRTKRLEYGVWKFRQELERIIPEETGSRKLQNRIDSMKESLENYGTKEKKQ